MYTVCYFSFFVLKKTVFCNNNTIVSASFEWTPLVQCYWYDGFVYNVETLKRSFQINWKLADKADKISFLINHFNFGLIVYKRIINYCFGLNQIAMLYKFLGMLSFYNDWPGQRNEGWPAEETVDRSSIARMAGSYHLQ